jgi:hypothetical protein
MLNLRHYAGFLLLALLTAASGLLAERLAHGNVTALEAAAERLKHVPADFGDWQKEADAEIHPEAIEMLECKGSINRVYRHRGTGQIIRMFVIVGPPGPTSVHSPEICYSSAGYQSREEPERFFVHPDSDSSPAFWKVWLKTGGPTPEQLAVVFGWNPGTGWVAADYPRFAFAGKPFLYKLQMATSVGDDAQATDNGCQQFLESFLPVLDSTLFGRQAG